MSIVNSCYDFIIGLSQTVCDCWDDGKPSDYNTSESGLFLADLDPIASIEGLANCENSDVWNILDTARENAIMQFIADTNARLIKDNKFKRPQFSGLIGEKKKTAYLTPSKTYIGTRFVTPIIKSGVAKITNIGIWLDVSATFNLVIYNNYNEVIKTQSITSIAGTYANNVVDIELPLEVEGREYVEYIFVYESTGKKPANSQLKCSVCGAFKPSFNILSPYYNQGLKDKRYMWQLWCMLGGFYSDTLDFSDLDDTADNYTNGLFFDVQFKCNVNEVLCKDALNYTVNPLAAAMAHAILYKAAEIVIRQMISPTKIHQKIAMNQETLAQFMVDYRDKYKEMLDYIVSEADITGNDCLECRDLSGMIKHGIFA